MTLTTYEFTPESMNIELTTSCPLRCSQCYCSLNETKNISLETAIYWITEGGKHGVKSVMLSGGEALCYPYLYEVVEAASKHCGTSIVALSGFDFSQDVLDRLINVGISGIAISLNGSTEAINSKTRNGFDLSISALQLLSDNEYQNTYINWVMHNNNSDDFINIIELAEKYNVKSIVVIALKPDSNHSLLSIPTKKQMLSIKELIYSYNGTVKIQVESCYSPMLALMLDTKVFGNLNTGKYRGCTAGKYSFSVNVDGKLSPCRHLDFFEDYTHLEDYFNKSEILQKIREVELYKQRPCDDCLYSKYCMHCLAINTKTKGGLFIGDETCPLQ